jgi:DNA ligase D-like protein (predicted 3'-phosphoesterase)
MTRRNATAGSFRRVDDARAVCVRLAGVQDPGAPAAIRRRARRLRVQGWVRELQPGSLELHAEGPASAVHKLIDHLLDLATEQPAVEQRRVEGHEQFALRGVSAGVFVVQEHRATAHHFDLRLQVGRVMRSWAVPKGPSLDPAVKRLAVQVADHDVGHNSFEGAGHGGGVIVWDRGTYEQGGRVPWPEALERGHAVFVLHGDKLQGGFALQRTGRGEPPQWLLIKRRDEHARTGWDVVAERPESVVTGRTLGETIDA